MAVYHDLANAFPMMSDDEFAALVEDIDKNGLLHPVVMFEGKILDGRNRYEATQKLGVPHREIKFTGEDPAAFVASENLRRRHLTPTQLAVAAEALANAIQGRPKTSKGPAGPEEPEHVASVTTINKAAELTGASPTAIKRVRKVRKTAAPEVVQAMESGALTATAAENLSTLPVEEQQEAVAAGPKAAAAKANQADAARRAAPAKQKPQVRLNGIMEDPDLFLVTELAKVFEEHAAIVPKLNRDKALLFAKRLRDNRTATTRLIKLIEDAHKS